MPTFEGSQGIIANNCTFYDIAGNQIQNTVESPPIAPPPPAFTAVFKRTLVLKHADFSPSFAVFTHDGGRIISCCHDTPVIMIWDSTTGAIIKGPLTFAESPSSRQFVVLSQDGKRLLTGGGSFCAETASSWDIETSQSTVLTLGKHGGWALSYDGTKLFTYAYFPTKNPTRVWDLVAGTCVSGETKPSGASQSAFSRDGTKIITVDAHDGRLNIWDAETADIMLGPYSHGHFGTVRSLSFSPDATVVALGLSTGKILLMECETGDILPASENFGGHTDWISSLDFSPDGKWIVSASWDLTIRMWDAKTGFAVSRAFIGHQDRVVSVVFSPDGKKVVSTSWDRTVRIWTLQ